MQTYLLVCLVLFFAGFAHGLSGFASILISIPLLSFFLDIKSVIPLVALSTLSMTVMLLIQLRHSLDLRKIYPLLIGSAPGIPIGVFFLKRLDPHVMQYAMGVMLIMYALYTLLSKKSRGGIREGWAYPFGFLSGCLGGALGTPGPPIVVYTFLQDWEKDKLKGGLQVCWLITFIIIVALHALSGLTTIHVLRFYGLSLPLLLLGTYVGSLLYGKINENQYRKLMLILLCFLGGVIIYRA